MGNPGCKSVQLFVATSTYINPCWETADFDHPYLVIIEQVMHVGRTAIR